MAFFPYRAQKVGGFVISEIIVVFFNLCCRRSSIFRISSGTYGDRGNTVVKALCYESEGRWFDPR